MTALLNTIPSTLEKHFERGRAAAGGSVDSDVEADSEAVSSIGLHCQLSEFGPNKEIQTKLG